MEAVVAVAAVADAVILTEDGQVRDQEQYVIIVQITLPLSWIAQIVSVPVPGPIIGETLLTELVRGQETVVLVW
jgi:hypothetical protein